MFETTNKMLDIPNVLFMISNKKYSTFFVSIGSAVSTKNIKVQQTKILIYINTREDKKVLRKKNIRM